MAFRLALALELSQIHNVFHISMLRRYRSDPNHILQALPLEVKDNLTYKKEPVEIVARESKVLRNKAILLVKVLWKYHGSEEST